MKKGFTMIELLVASLLLAMLVTILTMMFNQSAIAWRTGTAGVVNMNNTRASLGTFADIRDDVLPGLGDSKPSVGSGDNRTIQYRTVSLWDKNQPNQLRTPGKRAFNRDQAIEWGRASNFDIQQAMVAQEIDVQGAQGTQSVSPYSVGVRSLGPDGRPDTPDDITTWPEEID